MRINRAREKPYAVRKQEALEELARLGVKRLSVKRPPSPRLFYSYSAAIPTQSGDKKQFERSLLKSSSDSPLFSNSNVGSVRCATTASISHSTLLEVCIADDG